MADKCFEEVLRDAFIAGIRFGVRYPELDAIPIEEHDLQFRALRAAMRGEPWTPGQWQQARIDAGLLAPLPLHRTEAGYPRCSTCDGGGCRDCTDPA